MKKKTSVFLFILLFLLIVAIVFVVLTSLDKQLNPREAETIPEAEAEMNAVLETTPSPAPAATEAPVAAAPVINNSVVATPVPATPVPATPAPTTAPFATIETPMPSTVPMPVPTTKPGEPLGSGSFQSGTGTGLNIRAEWSAETSGSETAKVTVTIYADSWSLYLSPATKTVNISLSGQYVSLDAPGVQHPENTALTTELGTATFAIPLAAGESTTQDLEVEWHYNGSYGGVEIPSLECGGLISLSR